MQYSWDSRLHNPLLWLVPHNHNHKCRYKNKCHMQAQYFKLITTAVWEWVSFVSAGWDSLDTFLVHLCCRTHLYFPCVCVILIRLYNMMSHAQGKCRASISHTSSHILCLVLELTSQMWTCSLLRHVVWMWMWIHANLESAILCNPCSWLSAIVFSRTCKTKIILLMYLWSFLLISDTEGYGLKSCDKQKKMLIFSKLRSTS